MLDLPALSVRQPWAHLIVHGLKDIENRGWGTSHRGPLLIHAAQKFDVEAWRWIRSAYPDVPLPDRNSFELGGIIGRVNVVDVVRSSDSRWFFGPVGLVLQDAEVLPFVPGPGRLGVFEFKPAEAD
jgi:hypothetical protein